MKCRPQNELQTTRYLVVIDTLCGPLHGRESGDNLSLQSRLFKEC